MRDKGHATVKPKGLAAEAVAGWFGTPVLIGIYDQTDRLRYANRAFREAFALSADETPLREEIAIRSAQTGRGVIIRSADLDFWIASVKSRRGKLSYRSYEVDLTDGRWIWMTETTDADGWLFCLESDISGIRVEDRELRQARDLALRASYTDDLTGVANRRSMMTALDMLCGASAANTISHGSVCLIGLDHFKRISDTFGHQVGDELLVAFARFVQSTIRRRDSFGRIGGEEFMLILPDTTIREAERIIRDLIGESRSLRLLPGRPELSLACSAGIAGLSSGICVRELYRCLDHALFTAKSQGRDRLEVALQAPSQAQG